MHFRRSLFCLLVFCVTFSDGYFFDCLDKCECDTDDSAIHCHNNLTRQSLFVPEKQLRGFIVIGLTQNDIRNLPTEKILLQKFPDLQVVDVELNPNFNCSSLLSYKHINILSSCALNASEIARLINETIHVEGVGKPTPECDFKCQSKKHYESLHEYFKKLWEMLKLKFNEATKDSRFFQELQNFFSDIGKHLRKMSTQIQHQFENDKVPITANEDKN